ncbi:murein hydrolase effector protein LrgB [Chitiniphilus shinanonensis]|uniref:Murein hydrolase effector protein LrgB n=1 Tax=Chitiniphilus shinanonensis TaxID=553088 RepID=A0ABQ6BY70_9NEIS|nr:LrgB family protein [Chitiniphilus shinanonensis]GLS04719.1 murein hydrolase effector protein LrgB [Chitiniphilus shinanonensis]
MNAAAHPWLALACLLLTVAVYACAKWLYARHRAVWFAPLLFAPVVLVGIVLAAGIPYPVYIADARWLMWMLGPTTLAFAIPIHDQRAVIRRNPVTIAAGVLAGVALGVGSSWLLARAFHLPPELAHSLLPRSVSTPFAMTATDAFGGSRELTALFVVVTGVFGMMTGELVLRLLPLRSRMARGAMLGAASHGAGTAKARELGEEEGVVASLTMTLAGIALVLVAPLLAGWLG